MSGVALTARLGAGHRETRRLRDLLRDPRARRQEGRVVLEGLRVIHGALVRAAVIETLYLGPDGEHAFARLAAGLPAGVRIVGLRDGVLERIGTVQTPQPVLAVAEVPSWPRPTDWRADRPVLVTAGVSDPGNLGTLLRSAEAAGAAGVVCAGGVDVRSPKVVRASAGAFFGIPILEVDDVTGERLAPLRDALGARRWWAAVAGAGRPFEEADLAGGPVLVVGSEAHGLPPAVSGLCDDRCHIPMESPIAGAAESLNVGVAGSVLLFEAAAQRRRRSRVRSAAGTER